MQKDPFTLFVTTESGHHFSATVSTENSLGKTIEFVPQTMVAIKKTQSPVVQIPKPQNANMIENLMAHLAQKKPVTGYDVKHHYGKVIRLQQGLVLLPRLTYVGKVLS